ncbi:2-hydroxyacyl-CoA dehydratase subunit D [Chloroflexota bacterium]
MSTLEELIDLGNGLANPAVQEWKGKGKKVVGYYCPYVPEEILYAADILPFRVRAPGCTETTSADVYMSSINCSFVRSCLQFVLEGEYDFLDGLVVLNTCDQIRRQYDLLKEVKPQAFPFLHFIGLPHKSSDEAVRFYRDDLIEFKNSVENAFGVEITEDKLRNAIEVYNETRSLLRKLYELRQGEKPPLTGTETLSVVLAGTSIPKDQYNQLLRRLLEELGQREGISDYRARLMIAGGGGCDNPAYYQIIEELGGLIVTDNICFGSRYFWEPVEIGDDLMLGLARSYLNRPSCVKMLDKVAERDNYMKKMVEDFKADGVIFQVIRYCQNWGGQQFQVRKTLNESNIPLLILEREYTLGGTGQLKTRVQAFLERIE